jgi:hypothetical protein
MERGSSRCIMLEAVAKNCIFMINIREGGKGRGRSSFSANSPLSLSHESPEFGCICLWTKKMLKGRKDEQVKKMATTTPNWKLTKDLWLVLWTGYRSLKENNEEHCCFEGLQFGIF